MRHVDVIGFVYLATFAVIAVSLIVIAFRSWRRGRGKAIGGFLPPQPGDVDLSPVRRRRLRTKGWT